MAWSEYTCIRKRCLSLRHSGCDAFSETVIFLPRFVTVKALQFDAKNNCFSITRTSQTRPRIDGVRTSVAYLFLLCCVCFGWHEAAHL